MKVKLFDAAAEDAEIDFGLDEVARSGRYVDGPERDEFEYEFAQYLGAKYVVSVNSGTDALEAAIRAETSAAARCCVTCVIPSNTFRGTESAVRNAGISRVYGEVDADGLLTIDASSRSAQHGYPVVSVDLCGHSCSAPGFVPEWIVHDCCQSLFFYEDGPCAYSFHPTKPLGGYGTGGAVATNNPRVAEFVRQWRWHGARGGRNSRLPEVQARVLRRKLPLAEGRAKRRRQIALRYIELLTEFETPRDVVSYWHTFPLKLQGAARRADLAAYLNAQGVETKPAYFSLHPLAADWADRVLYLPVHTALTDDQVEYVAQCCNSWRTEIDSP